ncbi:MAG: hypothetical protein JSW73_04480 [Candidatus Woesearchaeota archaeon]|nr:MAG: hypothetical protein JSW73_04480 [Candidatus Woesearchaeota archaeon]
MDLKIIVPVLIVATIFVSGCSGLGGAATLDVSSIVKQIPEIKAFLDEHPDAEISIVFWKSDYLENNTDKISEKCMPAIEAGESYYRAEIIDEGGTIIAWLTSDAREAICVIRKATGVKSLAVEETQDTEPETPPTPEPETQEAPVEEETNTTNETVENSTVEEEPEEEETPPESTDPVLILDQECDEGLLFLTIQNNRDKDITTNGMKTIFIVKDEDGEDVCSKGLLAIHDDFKCNSGCDETIKKGETEKIAILLSKCEDFMAFGDYDYKLIFDDVSIEGTFTYKK